VVGVAQWEQQPAVLGASVGGIPFSAILQRKLNFSWTRFELTTFAGLAVISTAPEVVGNASLSHSERQRVLRACSSS
jgi:hypothetical protein